MAFRTHPSLLLFLWDDTIFNGPQVLVVCINVSGSWQFHASFPMCVCLSVCVCCQISVMYKLGNSVDIPRKMLFLFVTEQLLVTSVL